MNQSLPTFERLLDASVPRLSLWSRRTTPAQRRTLLRLIATAQEERLSLIPLLEAHLEDERGPQKRRIRFLLRFLRQGTPLADAIEQVPGILSDEEMLSIRFGAQSGILAQAIRATLDDPPLVTPRTRNEVRKVGTYCSVIFTFGMLFLIFYHTMILPKFYVLSDDFGIQPNTALRGLQIAGRLASDNLWIVLLAAIFVLWLSFSTSGGRFVRRAVAGRMFRSLRQWRAAEVLQRLSLAARTGRPLPGVLPPWLATTSIRTSATNCSTSATKSSWAPISGKVWRPFSYSLPTN